MINLVCINCPMGCRMQIEMTGKAIASIEGNQCKKGLEYAQQEAIEPMRMLTAVLRLTNRSQPLSVKTASSIPKKRYMDVIEKIRGTDAMAPIMCGDIIIEGVCGTGVNVIATQDIE